MTTICSAGVKTCESNAESVLIYPSRVLACLRGNFVVGQVKDLEEENFERSQVVSPTTTRPNKARPIRASHTCRVLAMKAGNNYMTLMPGLGNAIDTALAHWETYLGDLEHQPGYSTIIEQDPKSPESKAKALQYVLFTLPERHTMLVRSCSAAELEAVQLPDVCGNLLDELQSTSHEIDLLSWFNSVTSTKKFVDRVVALEKDIREEEMRRRQDLSRLKAVHIAFTQVGRDGELGLKDVEVLVNAMEAIGVSLVGPSSGQEADVNDSEPTGHNGNL